MEILEDPAQVRYTAEPVKFNKIYDFYKRALSAQWVPDEINEELGKDAKNWQTLPKPVQEFIKFIVAFFAVSDGVVGEILEDEVQSRITVPEAKIWYAHQAAMENVHAIVYSRLVLNYVPSAERSTVFNAITNYPSIKRKISWLHRWVGRENPFRHINENMRVMLRKVVALTRRNMENSLYFLDNDVEMIDPNAPLPQFERFADLVGDDPKSLAQVIIANAIMEGVFFSGSFCAIFWVNHQYPGILPGLAKANEWISRDEGMHTDFAVMLVRNYINAHLEQSVVHKMFAEAVDVESEFCASALPQRLPGMNAELMTQYIKFVADLLLVDLGYERMFDAENPFAFMLKQSMSVRLPDFFQDQNVSEYALATNDGLDMSEFDDDF